MPRCRVDLALAEQDCFGTVARLRNGLPSEKTWCAVFVLPNLLFVAQRPIRAVDDLAGWRHAREDDGLSLGVDLDFEPLDYLRLQPPRLRQKSIGAAIWRRRSRLDGWSMAGTPLLMLSYTLGPS